MTSHPDSTYAEYRILNTKHSTKFKLVIINLFRKFLGLFEEKYYWQPPTLNFLLGYFCFVSHRFNKPLIHSEHPSMYPFTKKLTKDVRKVGGQLYYDSLLCQKEC